MDTIIEAFGLTQLVQVDDQYFLRDGLGAGPALAYLEAVFQQGLNGDGQSAGCLQAWGRPTD